ncbi:MAG: GAF domain-containing sensor histidine kinase [Anaerolineaceae bacterium]|nr:GAF domain-containing sensor histidine kinase [Anaerolineaceae bacterium]
MTQLKEKITILQRLAEISLVLNSTLELPDLLGYLMDAAARITGSEAASVLLWDKTTRELRFAATTTDQTDINLIGQPVPLEGSIAGVIMQRQTPMQVDDTLSDPRHYTKTDQDNQFQTRSLLGVPMVSRTDVIGVLEVVNKHQLPWTEDDRDYLSVLAAQAAVAIESAQLVEALRKANRELSEIDALKNQFIALASHELRTPLAVVLGYASFLSESAEGETGDHVKKLMAAGLQLRDIIEDLTNLRYLQQNVAELQRGDIPLTDIIYDACKDANTLIDAKGHTLSLDLPTRSIRLYVDQVRLEMALANIINNAARFTPENGKITIKAEKRSDEVWISITDTGIGLEPEHLDLIFNQFYQVESPMTRTYGGLGIGLSIARAMVEAHSGRIWATSPGLNQGTTITIALPLAKLTKSE